MGGCCCRQRMNWNVKKILDESGHTKGFDKNSKHPRSGDLFKMGGPNLEIFKFSLYLFVPIAALVHFGDPAWYRETVVPYRNKLFPPPERTIQSLPTDRGDLKQELERLKAERLRRRAEREAEEKKQSKS